MIRDLLDKDTIEKLQKMSAGTQVQNNEPKRVYVIKQKPVAEIQPARGRGWHKEVRETRLS